MTTLLVCIAVAIVLLGVGILLLWKGGQDIRRAEETAPALPPPVPPVGPGVFVKKDLGPSPPPPIPTITVRLESAKGRELGTVKMDARHRRPVLRHRLKNGELSVFVAANTDASGTWVYRRVHVEREQ